MKYIFLKETLFQIKINFIDLLGRIIIYKGKTYMSNKIYKSEMKDGNRLLEKFVNISLIALAIIFVLLFLKIIVTEISFHKMIVEMVEGIDYYI